MRWPSFRSFFSRRWAKWCLALLLLGAVGAGKWQLNRLYVGWKAQSALDAAAYSADLWRARIGYEHELFILGDEKTRAIVSDVLGVPVREVSARHTGPFVRRECRADPKPGLTYHMVFHGNEMTYHWATTAPFVVREPWWWKPAEVLRFFTSYFALLLWIICIAAAADRTLRARFGRWSLLLALLCAMLWLGQPPHEHRLYEFQIPGGAWIGLGMAIVSLYMWRRKGPKASPDPICPHCDYNLTGNLSGICPECGHVTPAELQRRRDEEASFLARALITGE